MDRLILRLSRRRLFTALLAAGYFAAVVLSHKEVSRVFDWLREALSFEVYDSTMLTAGLFVGVLFALFILIKIKEGGGRRVKAASWLLTAALVGASYEVLIVFSVEVIHFIQYALLALPVFALTLRYGETVFWATLLGAVDEAYQYFVLYADNKEVYFDFNDIVLNLVGAGIGVLIIYTLSDTKAASFSGPAGSGKTRKRAPFVAAAFLLLICLSMFVTGAVKFYPEEGASGAPIVLSRKPAPSRFWEEPKMGKSFHILHPFEGVLLASFLIPWYSLMDRRRSKEH